MDELELKTMFGNLDPLPDVETRAGASGGRPLAKTAHARAISIVQTLDERFEAFENDSTLSKEGIQKKKSRAVRDASADLANVEVHRATLERELSDAKASFKPKVESVEATNAAIWSQLPKDAQSTATLYRDALGKGDSRTLNAIETMPGVFEGHLPADTLTELQRERIEIEAPDTFKAITTAEASLSLVTGAHAATAQHLVDLGQSLPNPDDGGEARLGNDGLREFSPSQFQEAL